MPNLFPSLINNVYDLRTFGNNISNAINYLRVKYTIQSEFTNIKLYTITENQIKSY